MRRKSSNVLSESKKFIFSVSIILKKIEIDKVLDSSASTANVIIKVGSKKLESEEKPFIIKRTAIFKNETINLELFLTKTNDFSNFSFNEKKIEISLSISIMSKNSLKILHLPILTSSIDIAEYINNQINIIDETINLKNMSMGAKIFTTLKLVNGGELNQANFVNFSNSSNSLNRSISFNNIEDKDLESSNDISQSSMNPVLTEEKEKSDEERKVHTNKKKMDNSFIVVKYKKDNYLRRSTTIKEKSFKNLNEDAKTKEENTDNKKEIKEKKKRVLNRSISSINCVSNKGEEEKKDFEDSIKIKKYLVKPSEAKRNSLNKPPANPQKNSIDINKNDLAQSLIQDYAPSKPLIIENNKRLSLNKKKDVPQIIVKGPPLIEEESPNKISESYISNFKPDASDLNINYLTVPNQKIKKHVEIEKEVVLEIEILNENVELKNIIAKKSIENEKLKEKITTLENEIENLKLKSKENKSTHDQENEDLSTIFHNLSIIDPNANTNNISLFENKEYLHENHSKLKEEFTKKDNQLNEAIDKLKQLEFQSVEKDEELIHKQSEINTLKQNLGEFQESLLKRQQDFSDVLNIIFMHGNYKLMDAIEPYLSKNQ